MLHSNLISYLYYSSSNIIIDLLGKPFPKTLHGAVRDPQVDCSIEKQVFVVCPKESCNALYKEGKTNNCTLTSYGKVCGASLGYTAHLSHENKNGKHSKHFNSFHLQQHLISYVLQKSFCHCWQKNQTNGTMKWMIYKMVRFGRNLKQQVSLIASITLHLCLMLIGIDLSKDRSTRLLP